MNVVKLALFFNVNFARHISDYSSGTSGPSHASSLPSSSFRPRESTQPSQIPFCRHCSHCQSHRPSPSPVDFPPPSAGSLPTSPLSPVSPLTLDRPQSHQLRPEIQASTNNPLPSPKIDAENEKMEDDDGMIPQNLQINPPFNASDSSRLTLNSMELYDGGSGDARENSRYSPQHRNNFMETQPMGGALDLPFDNFDLRREDDFSQLFGWNPGNESPFNQRGVDKNGIKTEFPEDRKPFIGEQQRPVWDRAKSVPVGLPKYDIPNSAQITQNRFVVDPSLQHKRVVQAQIIKSDSHDHFSQPMGLPRAQTVPDEYGRFSNDQLRYQQPHPSDFDQDMQDFGLGSEFTMYRGDKNSGNDLASLAEAAEIKSFGNLIRERRVIKVQQFFAEEQKKNRRLCFKNNFQHDGADLLLYTIQNDWYEMVEVMTHYREKFINKGEKQYLSAAVYGQHHQIARILLCARANPNEKTVEGYTPLHIAAKNGNIKLVKLLIQFNAVPSNVASGNVNPLHVAVHHCNQIYETRKATRKSDVVHFVYEIIKKLNEEEKSLLGKKCDFEHLESDFLPSVEDDSDDGYDSSDSIEGSPISMLDQKKKAKIKKWGMTPLMMAVRSGNFELVQKLYELSGEDLRVKQENGGLSPYLNSRSKGALKLAFKLREQNPEIWKFLSGVIRTTKDSTKSFTRESSSSTSTPTPTQVAEMLKRVSLGGSKHKTKRRSAFQFIRRLSNKTP